MENNYTTLMTTMNTMTTIMNTTMNTNISESQQDTTSDSGLATPYIALIISVIGLFSTLIVHYNIKKVKIGCLKFECTKKKNSDDSTTDSFESFELDLELPSSSNNNNCEHNNHIHNCEHKHIHNCEHNKHIHILHTYSETIV